MLRLVTRIVQSHADPKSLQSISAKPFFKHYKTAINLSLQNRLEESNAEFLKSLQQIKVSKQNQLQHFSYILRRMAHNYRRLGKMKMAQQQLYHIIKHKRQCNVISALLYDDYDLLFRHMVTYDLQKAVKLCKALLIKQKDDMPLSFIKLFNFNLGTAYLVSGNYVDAKARLSKCLESDPQGKLKSYVLNNLGLACWWHKNPIQKVRDNIENHEAETVEKDFKQTKDIFGRAILLSQLGGSQISQVKKIMLEQSLNFKNGKLNENLELSQSASLLPAYNIAKYYISNDPIQKFQILFWLNKSLNLAKTSNNEIIFERIFCQYSLLTHNLQTLMEKLPQMVEKNRYSQQFADEMYYCEVLANLLSKNIETKQKASAYFKRVQLIRNVIPPWTAKLRYVALEPLILTN